MWAVWEWELSIPLPASGGELVVMLMGCRVSRLVVGLSSGLGWMDATTSVSIVLLEQGEPDAGACTLASSTWWRRLEP